MTQKEINEKEWANPKSCKWYLIYYSKKDTRIWVPKKPRWCGWTLNFARKKSYLYLALLILGITLITTIPFLMK